MHEAGHLCPVQEMNVPRYQLKTSIGKHPLGSRQKWPLLVPSITRAHFVTQWRAKLTSLGIMILFVAESIVNASIGR
jgi:hypothetical protein